MRLNYQGLQAVVLEPVVHLAAEYNPYK
jgi:hypothetical protein